MTAREAKVERLQCASPDAARQDLRVLEGTTVLKVEPQHYWDLCLGISKITGTTLLVHGPPGVSAEQLARSLQCASARATLGHSDLAELARDPRGLPGPWMDIDVAPEGDNFAVTLRADTVSNNIQLLRRATACAAAQRSPVNQ
jgi:hypothetical protein